MNTAETEAVPAFLTRPAGGARRARRAQAASARKWVTPVAPAPKGKVWEGAGRYRVHFTTQAPRIGSGVRFVWAVVGWKHVRVYAGWGDRQRIARKDWDAARPEKVEG